VLLLPDNEFQIEGSKSHSFQCYVGCSEKCHSGASMSARRSEERTAGDLGQFECKNGHKMTVKSTFEALVIATEMPGASGEGDTCLCPHLGRKGNRGVWPPFPGWTVLSELGSSGEPAHVSELRS